MQIVLKIMWKDVMSTASLAVAHSYTPYVSPYLINSFIQYLNGHRRYAPEGLQHGWC